MRKQTKLVAVLSTAALLAIGASMTSFAATGWQEEDGTWVYYDNDEERVTETWKRSGNNWFWLDDNGEMAVDQLIEDDEDYYYVNESGAMVSNQWVAIENEDAGEEDEPDVYWYYFQSNGKAYKRSDSASEDVVAAKTINGKKYSFDTEGRMLYGWVSGGERQTGDDAWKNADYYFGDENDGAMAQRWTILTVVDDEAAEDLSLVMSSGMRSRIAGSISRLLVRKLKPLRKTWIRMAMRPSRPRPSTAVNMVLTSMAV